MPRRGSLYTADKIGDGLVKSAQMGKIDEAWRMKQTCAKVHKKERIKYRSNMSFPRERE